MEQLIYTINNTNYVLIELLITDRNKIKHEKLIEKYEIIIQGMKKFDDGGWFGVKHLILNVLVPEKDVLNFQNELNL